MPLNFFEFLSSTDLGRILTTFFVSMVPVVELRGAIPIGVGLGLGHITSMLVSIVGNMIPVPFIILFVRRVFMWMRQKSAKLGAIAEKLEQRAYKKQGVIKKWQVLGLIIFVAIPLPGTGAWTGALIAALLDIRLKSAVPAIFIGVIIAGVLVTGITYGFTSIF